mgnify:FL=1
MTAVDRGWREGNRYTLLENGEVYFPAVRRAIDSARHLSLIHI